MEADERIGNSVDRLAGRNGLEHGILIEDWKLGHGGGTILSPAW
jgi:hypothetical protein